MHLPDLRKTADRFSLIIKKLFAKIHTQIFGFGMHRIKNISIILIGLIVIFAFISLISHQNGIRPDDSEVSNIESELSGSSYVFESNISLSDSGQSSSSSDTDENSIFFQPLIDDIVSHLNSYDGRAGVYVIDISTRKSFGINENTPFVAANSIKLPIITFLYNEIATGNLSLTDKMIYDSRPYPEGDMTEGAGFIINEPDGTEFSIRRISQLAITISDNCAANMAIRKLGGIKKVAEGLSMISATIPYAGEVIYYDYTGTEVKGMYRSSPKDLAVYTRYLYDLWQNSSNLYQPLIDDLSQTVFDFGIQSSLPRDIKVAHKIGTNSQFGTENDTGIVFSDNPYVICVTTEGSDRNEGRKLIADISLMVYEFLNE